MGEGRKLGLREAVIEGGGGVLSIPSKHFSKKFCMCKQFQCSKFIWPIFRLSSSDVVSSSLPLCGLASNYVSLYILVALQDILNADLFFTDLRRTEKKMDKFVLPTGGTCLSPVLWTKQNPATKEMQM